MEKSFFLFQNGASTGVEREQRFDEELHHFPLMIDSTINKKVKQLIKIKRLIKIHKRSSFPDEIKIYEYQKQFQDKETALNEFIFDLYNLSETERNLIDYTQKITIPIFWVHFYMLYFSTITIN